MTSPHSCTRFIVDHTNEDTPVCHAASRVAVAMVSDLRVHAAANFFFDNGENANQAAENVNGVYGSDTVTAVYVQFWFRLFHSCIFDVKNAPRAGRPVVENVDKITEIIQVDRHVSSRSIVRELKNDHKTV
ncbi:histone-lysine N-methyltransferase SETMAR [Trichonephila clavipes]|nr:histone-lysine N-methyltransferase SETMAR [Trichonephila clavipes]